jgi:hypothetical protein
VGGRILCVFAIVILLSNSVCKAEPVVMITNSQPACGNLKLMQDLWKDCGYGKDPNRTERSAWIIRTPQGGIIFMRWAPSASRNKEYWRGPIPKNVVAQIHTHPVNLDRKPSNKDANVARSLNIPVYVISVKGIWSVTPDGATQEEVKSDWYQNLSDLCN